MNITALRGPVTQLEDEAAGSADDSNTHVNQATRLTTRLIAGRLEVLLAGVPETPKAPKQLEERLMEVWHPHDLAWKARFMLRYPDGLDPVIRLIRAVPEVAAPGAQTTYTDCGFCGVATFCAHFHQCLAESSPILLGLSASPKSAASLELDQLVADYKHIADNDGEHRIKDLVWLVNELIYERENRAKE